MTVLTPHAFPESDMAAAESSRKSILLLALGNDIMGDDAVGLHAATELREKFDGRIEVREAMIAGYSLLEILDGYSHVLLIDAISTGGTETGTVREYSTDEFESYYSASPHYVGIPEVFALGRGLGLVMPVEFRILTMEISHPFELREELTPEIQTALPEFIRRAEEIIRDWL